MPTWKSVTQAHQFMDYVFMKAVRIVADGVWRRAPNGEYKQVIEPRPWFAQQYHRHHLHPAVYEIMTSCMYRAADWHQLLLEWPHKSLTDPSRLAYTRDEKSAMHNGDSDIKAVVTTIGKYLTRHFPDAPANLIRDISAKYTYGGTIAVTNDLGAMVHAVTSGPRSCMSPSFGIECDDRENRHPYAVYDPSLGWGMAVRTDTDGAVLGRCLVHESEDGKGFVRSYKRERDCSSHSGADEAIEVYLQAQGYAKWRGWPDHVRIMRYPLRRQGFLMPYIDGQNQHVSEDGDDHFSISCYADWEATTTSGIINGYNCTCENCGAGFNDDEEGGWVGSAEDVHVCQRCLDNDYTYVTGRRCNQYYVLSEYAVEADGDYYDERYLGDNSIVTLHNGDHTHIDNAVYVDSQDEYYDCDDEDVCYAENTNQYEMVHDCWQCAESGKWYTDDEESVEVDGETYHPDHAPEDEDDEEVEVIAVTDVTIESAPRITIDIATSTI